MKSTENMIASPRNLYEVLEGAASEHGDKGILIYAPGKLQSEATRLSYRDLLRQAQTNSILVHRLQDTKTQSNVVLHFNTHLDNIVWFWSIVVAGYVPVISTPFTNDIEQRKKHIFHLDTLLDHPIWIAKKDLLSEFLETKNLRISTVEQLQSTEPSIESVAGEGVSVSSGTSSPSQQKPLPLNDTCGVPTTSQHLDSNVGQDQCSGPLKE